MNSNEASLLKLLSKKNDWTSSKDIANSLSISKRSVFNYVNNINKSFDDIITTSINGFLIFNKERAFFILKQIEKNDVPQTIKQREKFIIKIMLLEKKPHEIYKLSEQLAISITTLNKELYNISKHFLTYNLRMKTRKGFLYLEGDEKDIKNMISQMILNESKDSFLTKNIIKAYFPEVNINLIEEIIDNKLFDLDLHMDDFSRKNLILHIVILISRKNDQQELLYQESNNNIEIAFNIKLLIKEILASLTHKLNVSFTRQDEYDLSILVMTRIQLKSYDLFKGHNIENIIGYKLSNLIKRIGERVSEVYGFSLNKIDFQIRFALHIKNMIIRLENSIILKNPQLEFIKNRHPFIYDISVFIANLIFQEYNYQVPEDEIAYISIHIGVEIEEQNNTLNNIDVLLVNPYYLLDKESIAKKIECIFYSQITIIGVIPDYYDIEKYKNYDLLISTHQIDDYTTKNCVVISSFINKDDIDKISKGIETVIRRSQQEKFVSSLRLLFKPNCFWVNANFVNDHIAIDVMAQTLIDNHYVDLNYKNELYERESISSSSFNNIAIPHPLVLNAIESTIAVSINQKPISWGSKQVNLVFMLAINESDKVLFKDIFDFITRIVSDDSKLDKILTVKTFVDFLDLLISYF